MLLPNIHTGKQGTTSVIATGSTPLTKRGDTSPADTVFTATGMTCTGTWSQTGMAVKDIAVTSDGYVGVITALATKSVTVKEWVHSKTGKIGTPANTSTVTVHRVFQCKTIKIKAGTVTAVHVSRDGVDATTSDFILLSNESIVLQGERDSEWVDVSKINVISSSGTVSISWITDALQ